MAHALLGASKAEQWLNCPPSARLQEHVPDKGSEFAAAGTLAHALAENRLRRNLTLCNSATRKKLDTAYENLKKDEMYCTEMENAVTEYITVVTERYMEVKYRTPDAIILLEEKLDYREWVPGGFGTGDVIIIADDVLEVIDFKYGTGVLVDATGNPQLRLYGLGAWAEYNLLYDIQTIKMTIMQPRRDNLSTDIISVEDLLTWADTIVRPTALLADAGEGEFKSGDHCKWCRVKATCRARADENMKALEYQFQEPALLSNDEIGPILFIAQQLQTWAKDIQDYAYDQALKGEQIPQWKLVEGKSNRKIPDEDKAKDALKDAGYDTTVYIKQSLYGIGELEKRVGKKELTSILDGLIIKPPGSPVLVPETDNRPELNSMEKDFENIEMEECING
ncbi:MAG TPA: DUF2800 domain-containing protein [Syntrophomonas sp.]|nr:DUF2800 domain-containing protein [Syntrophomonas sp.]